MPREAGFSGLDWIVLGGYFVGLAAMGVALSRKQSGTEDYFLGGRRMPAWAVSLSVVATAILAYIVKAVIGLRPTKEDELQGLDYADHGEAGYHPEEG